MQYGDTPEQSAELLKLALPMMSRQAVALHPVSYSVWYAYFAMRPVALRAEVDRQLAQHGQLDEARTLALYRHYLSDFDPSTAGRVAGELEAVIAHVADDTDLAQQHTAQYGAQLERAAAGEWSAAAVDSLMSSTTEMQRQMGELNRRLVDSQGEIGRLRDEVERALRASRQDALTGLANRRELDVRLAAMLAAASAAADTHVASSDVAPGAAVAMLMGDIDHFKRINDTYGHGFGDQVLKAIAQLLRQLAPAQALVARYGGEEFALVLPEATAATARALAERLRGAVAGARIRRGQQDSGETERVTISIGVALAPRGSDAASLAERADRALYRAKHTGRDRVIVDGD